MTILDSRELLIKNIFLVERFDFFFFESYLKKKFIWTINCRHLKKKKSEVVKMKCEIMGNEDFIFIFIFIIALLC